MDLGGKPIGGSFLTAEGGLSVPVTFARSVSDVPCGHGLVIANDRFSAISVSQSNDSN
jgi:hypothetical protein